MDNGEYWLVPSRKLPPEGSDAYKQFINTFQHGTIQEWRSACRALTLNPVSTANRLWGKGYKRLGTLEAPLEPQVEIPVVNPLEDLLKRVSTIPKIELRPPPLVKKKGDEETQVLLFSDSQVGQLTPDYNASVFRSEMVVLQQRIQKLCFLHRRIGPVKKLVIFFLGDIIENERVGFQLELDELEKVLLDQIFEITVPAIAELLINLLQTFEIIECYCVRGNHGKISKFSASSTNLDSFVYRILELYLKEFNRIKWFIEDKRFFNIAEVMGHKFLLVHGDQIPCVDIDTEALTQDGWKPYSQLSKGDMLLTYNIEHRNAEFQPLQNLVVTPYNGSMVNVYNRNMDMLMTPNHRCVVEHSKQVRHEGRVESVLFVPEMVTADSLNSQTHMLLAAPLRDDYYEQKYSDDFLRLVGWLLAEGSIQNKYGIKRRYKITQSMLHAEYVAEIENTINSLGYSYTKRVTDAEGYSLRRGGPKAKRVDFYFAGDATLVEMLSQTKPFPRWILQLPTRQLRILFDALMKGDGSARDQHLGSPYGEYFWQADERSNDLFQELATLLGIRTTKSDKDYKGNGAHKIFMAYRSPHAEIRPKSKGQVKEVQYDGLVWCPETGNGTWYARRHGKVFITGNSYMSLPHYGVDRRVGRWKVNMPKDFDICCMGHFHSHNFMTYSGVPTIINSTFVKGGDYPLHKMGLSDQPCQVCFFVHPKRAITAYYTVDFSIP